MKCGRKKKVPLPVIESAITRAAKEERDAYWRTRGIEALDEWVAGGGMMLTGGEAVPVFGSRMLH